MDKGLEAGNAPRTLLNSPGLTKAVSATAGAVITSLLVTPLDVVKVRMQSQPVFWSAGARNGAFSMPSSVSTPLTSYVFCSRFWDHKIPCTCRTLYIFDRPASTTATAALQGNFGQGRGLFATPTLTTIMNISRREGWRALWKGLTPTLAMALPATIVYFLAYENLRDTLQASSFTALQQASPLLAGSAARLTAVSLISPLELFRTRLQHHPGSTRNGWRSVGRDLFHLVRTQGLVSLYRGLVPTLWRDVPFSAIYWLVYEQTKRALVKSEGEDVHPFTTSFTSGAIAGTVAAIMTTPFDVAKTRRQVGLTTSTIRSSGTIFGILKEIWFREGLRGLMLGIGPRVAKVAPACAIMVGTYEFGKSLLQQPSSSSSSSLDY